MLLTENTSKAGSKQEQCQDTQLPCGNVLSQETLPVKINAWKSTEVSHLWQFSCCCCNKLPPSQCLKSAAVRCFTVLWVTSPTRLSWANIKVSGCRLHSFLEAPRGEFVSLSFPASASCVLREMVLVFEICFCCLLLHSFK